MAVPKIWAAYERLTSDDLNLDFAYLDGRQNSLAVPAGTALPVGATVAGVAGGGAEIFPGAPVAGTDPFAFYVAATKRLTIPAGMGGIYIVNGFGTCIGGTAANARRVTLTGAAQLSAGGAVGAGGTATFWLVTYVGPITAGTALVWNASGLTTAADFTVSAMSIYRLGL